MDRIFLPIIIVAIVFSFVGLQHYLRYRLSMSKMKMKAQAANAELTEEVAEIRERLAALEKIVTDKGYRLKEEIDKL